MTKLPKKLISPSGMGAYYTCPRKFYYQTRWRPVKVDRALTDGTDAHLIMQGQRLKAINVRAQMFALKLKRLMGETYTLAGKRWAERSMIVVSPDGSFGIKQTIDRLAALDDEHTTPVILDYKTGLWGWWAHDAGKTTQIVPKAAGSFQSVAYLLPRPLPKDYPYEEWPAEIHYLNAPENGRADIYPYALRSEDVANFWEAAEIVATAAKFPYVRGYHCRYCPFLTKCFGREKRGEYIRRDDGPLEEDDL